MDLEAALIDADHAIEQTQRKLEQLQARLQALQEERRGLELAINRHGATTLLPSGTTEEWRNLNRTDAVERVLREGGGEAMSPSEILRKLQEHGREDDTPAYVSAALSYLARRRRAVRVRQGQWMALGTTMLASTAGVGGFLPAAGAVAAALAIGALAAAKESDSEAR